ncbi:hypothetical protein [Pseudomonas fluorescens]|uniref:hypothetical protein n=1 Tax=Pseudomonas fluorescens TaxID=294 RepID=UPI0010727E64|nr:hypothetical protein [Pseudomonas fluorescens]
MDDPPPDFVPSESDYVVNHEAMETPRGVVGQRTVLVVTGRWTGGSNINPTTVRNTTIADSATSLRGYLGAVSQGKLNLSGDLVADVDFGTRPQTCTTSTVRDKAVAQARAQGYDRANYDYLFVAMPYLGSCNWGGIAQLPGSWAMSNGTPSLSLWVHEFGHNLGFGHGSTFVNCPSNGSEVSAPVHCATKQNGDSGDPMLGGGTKEYPANYRLQAGWLTEDKAELVARSGTYRLNTLGTDGTQLLMLDRPQGWSRLTLEYRQPSAYDTFSPDDNRVRGVWARYSDMARTTTKNKQLDGTPETGTTQDPTLTQGKILVDEEAHARIEICSVDRTGAIVAVAVGNDSPAYCPGDFLIGEASSGSGSALTHVRWYADVAPGATLRIGDEITLTGMADFRRSIGTLKNSAFLDGLPAGLEATQVSGGLAWDSTGKYWRHDAGPGRYTYRVVVRVGADAPTQWAPRFKVQGYSQPDWRTMTSPYQVGAADFLIGEASSGSGSALTHVRWYADVAPGAKLRIGDEVTLTGMADFRRSIGTLKNSALLDGLPAGLEAIHVSRALAWNSTGKYWRHDAGPGQYIYRVVVRVGADAPTQWAPRFKVQGYSQPDWRTMTSPYQVGAADLLIGEASSGSGSSLTHVRWYADVAPGAKLRIGDEVTLIGMADFRRSTGTLKNSAFLDGLPAGLEATQVSSALAWNSAGKYWRHDAGPGQYIYRVVVRVGADAPTQWAPRFKVQGYSQPDWRTMTSPYQVGAADLLIGEASSGSGSSLTHVRWYADVAPGAKLRIGDEVTLIGMADFRRSTGTLKNSAFLDGLPAGLEATLVSSALAWNSAGKYWRHDAGPGQYTYRVVVRVGADAPTQWAPRFKVQGYSQPDWRTMTSPYQVGAADLLIGEASSGSGSSLTHVRWYADVAPGAKLRIGDEVTLTGMADFRRSTGTLKNSAFLDGLPAGLEATQVSRALAWNSAGKYWRHDAGPGQYTYRVVVRVGADAPTQWAPRFKVQGYSQPDWRTMSSPYQIGADDGTPHPEDAADKSSLPSRKTP